MDYRLLLSLCLLLCCSSPAWAQSDKKEKEPDLHIEADEQIDLSNPSGPINYQIDSTKLRHQARYQGYTKALKIPEGDLNDPAVRKYKNVPLRAAFYSAALPGLGQIYNHKYWKVPIIYGGAITIGYFVGYNDQYYQLFRTAAFDKDNGNPNGNPIADAYTIEQLEQRADLAQRNRDWSIVFMTVLYAMQIVDAHVDSHLRDFEISPNVSMGIQPTLIPNMTGTPAVGLCLNFSLK
ncbi:DUF5683 domain-containing protein [Persicobacter psychrovividus]|uniref:DUF5683 domain-containing protein n=1 Tax=Persicobacter psychrovividus TaxID=387638 RepID=A0ABN6L755_9BACT|nr:hypothetical protein PEPS_09540 [Persicobacter psychrovividus]